MIFSLKKRFLVFLLLPVTLVLLAIGLGSFFYARSYLLDEWTTTTRLRLEWTAHQIQMRLNRQREFIDLFVKAESYDSSKAIQAFIVKQMEEMQGVRSVEIQPTVQDKARTEGQRGQAQATGQSDKESSGKRIVAGNQTPHGCIGMNPAECPMQSNGTTGMRCRDLAIDQSQNLLSISRTFGGTTENPENKIVVTTAFDSFMKGILETGHWQQSQACLVKLDGTYLAHTNVAMNQSSRLGEGGDPLEKKVVEEMQTKAFGTVFGAGHPPDRVISFYNVPSTDWYLVLRSRGNVILAPVFRFSVRYGLAGILSLFFVGLLIHWNTRPMAQSVAEISEAAEAVSNGDYSVEVSEKGSDEIGLLKRRFNEMIRGLKERDLIEHTFGRYIDRRVAADLLAKPEALQLGGKHQIVTILMADLGGFTEMCEGLSPAQVIRILNRHFSAMIAVIEKYKGIIVDFYGDSVLAFFDGTDVDVTGRALDAIQCALAMQKELETVSERNSAEGLPELNMRTGIHTGEVIVGNIGSEIRAKYGIVGSAVNETDRIQSCADFGHTLVSEETYTRLADRLVVSRKPGNRLKGLESLRDLYDVTAVKDFAPA
ncbi:MAG TPA: adenylate/guanylate cyclase domain-containing protein [Desulfomonilaceae bacterium]|nr:adenylate/guanylate cyclase domain-containing protein [Desulfomonilaceae bacterium]